MILNRKCVSIHQPHYFPWLGYLDKIAKSDQFVVLDDVQFEKGSQMIRNRVIDQNGEIKYITISAETKGFLDKPNKEIEVKNMEVWKSRQISALSNYYNNANYKNEIINILNDYFKEDYSSLFEWTYSSIILCMKLLEIKTPIVLQSNINYDRNSKRSDLVLSICKELNASMYLSGNGASVAYLDREKFRKANIDITINNYIHPKYPQCNSSVFEPGLSVLDCFFNCGVEKTKRLFWDNIDSES